MDQLSGVKSILYRHRDAVCEVMRYPRVQDAVHMLLHVGILGFLIMLGLLKLMLLPPFPEGLRGALPPTAILKQASQPITMAELPPELKIISSKNPAHSKLGQEFIKDEAGSNRQPKPSIQLMQKPSPGYWVWLKPLLISAEIIPLVFFLWNGLRAYQITNRQRDWVMTLMGAHASDVHRLLCYRAVLLSLGASGVGVGGFTLLALYLKDVPLLPDVWGWSLVGGVLAIGLLLSVVANQYPPDAATDPML